MNTEKENKQLATTTHFGAMKFENLNELKAFGEEIAKSGLTPLKVGADVVAAVLYGKELGLEPMISVNNIYPINGRATLGVHLIEALLLKHGVITDILRDYEPCVAFAMKGEDGKAVMVDANGSTLTPNAEGKYAEGKYAEGARPYIVRIGFIDEDAKDYEVKGKKIVDYKTVVKMTRSVKQPDGTYKDMVITSSFSKSDAIQAGLYDLSKPNTPWIKYTKAMCKARSVANSGNTIGGDFLKGISETSMMADVVGLTYTVEDSKVVILESNTNTKEEKTDSTDSVNNGAETSRDNITPVE